MLLECDNCGAPLDVAENEKLTRCKYCGAISRAKALRTVAPVTPSGWQPPKQWSPPAHARIDTSRTLVYHATWAIGRLVKTVIWTAVLLALLPVAGLVAFTVLSNGTASGSLESTLKAAGEALKLVQSNVEAAQGQQGSPEGQLDLLTSDGAAGLLEQYRKALGKNRIQALSLTLHPSYASLEAQDPENATHVNRRFYRSGVVEAPQPVNVQKLGNRLGRALFDLDGVALDRMSELTQRALQELAFADAAVTHVLVSRHAPSTGGKVLVRVYASSPRAKGRVEFNADGSLHKVHR